MFALMKQSEKKTPSENPRENLSLSFFFFGECRISINAHVLLLANGLHEIQMLHVMFECISGTRYSLN